MPIDPIPAPSLTTPRLLLRPLAASDRDEYIRVTIASREHFARWLPLPSPDQTPEQAFDTALARCAATLADGTGCRLVAVLREPPGTTIAGFFNLNNISRGVFQNSDTGWSLAPDCTGRGLATEALTALLDLAFADPTVPPVPPTAALSGRCAVRERAPVAVGTDRAEPRSVARVGLGLHRVQANIIPDNHRSLALARRCGFRQEGLARRMLCIAGVWHEHMMFAKLADEHRPVYLTA